MSVRRAIADPVAVLLTLAAAGLRVLGMTGRSMWLDEGSTIARLAGTWDMLLRNILVAGGLTSTDIHPPLYFLLTRAWIGLAGDTEFAVKLVSVGFGVLSVPLTYALARAFFGGRRVARIAALFMLLNPVVEWYSHEARSYSMVVCLAALSTRLLILALRRPRWLAAWFAATLVSVATHYALATLAAVHAGMLAVQALGEHGALRRLWRASPRRAIAFLAACMAGVVILAVTIDLPFLIARIRSGTDRNFNFVPLNTILDTMLGGLQFGMNTADPTAGILNAAAGGLIMLGLPLTTRARARTAWVVLFASVAGPLLIWFGVSFVKPNFQGARHLIFMLPGMVVLLAEACRRLLERSALAYGLLALLVAIQGYGVAYGFVETPDWHDDWRGLAHYIRDNWTPGDVVITNGGTPYELIKAYLDGVPATVLPQRATGPDTLPATGAARLWFVNAGQSPVQDVAQAALKGVAWRLRDQANFEGRSNSLQVLLFELSPRVRDALPAEFAAVGSGDDSITRVSGVMIQAGNPYNPLPNARISLDWARGGEPLSDLVNHRVQVRLVHNGRAWLDWELNGNLAWAPETWTPGQFFRTEHVLPIPLGLPRIAYNLEITVLAGEKGEPVQRAVQPLPAGWLACCLTIPGWPDFTRHSPSVVWPSFKPPVMTPTPALHALADADVAGFEAPARTVPGATVSMVLTWRVREPATPAWDTELQLRPLLGAPVASVVRAAGDNSFAPPQWPAGQPVRDLYDLALPYHAPPGWYALVLLRIRGDSVIDRVLLGLIEVQETPLSPVPEQVPRRVDARVGPFTLLGFDVDTPLRAGTTVDVHTLWRADTRPDAEGVLFLHLVDDQGGLIAQDDSSPGDGLRSTLSYRPGEGLDLVHRLTLPADLAPGTYHLTAGIYDRLGGNRWEASQDGRTARDQLIDLGSVEVR